MNNSYQAKSGFKTFIFVFLISLGIFSLFYYLTSSSGKELDIENYSAPREDVLGETAEKSAFEELSKQQMPPPTVLAGADVREDAPETTQTTTAVPDTGFSGITMALFSSVAILSLGAYTLWTNPRKTALAAFERKIIEE